MQEGHTETCCEHTPRPVPQPLAHWQRYRYQWCCLESGVTSRKSSRVALLLKRDGPCDIHLIHDSLIKQPVFTPRRRELTSQKKVLPTLFYSHTDKMRLTTNPHLGWLMEGVKGQRCHRAHSRCGTQQGFMPREHAQVHGDHGCAGRRTQVPGTSGAGAQSIACEDQRDPVRVPSLGSCGPQGANCVSAFLSVTGEPKTTLKGRACHTASALGVR